VKTETKTETLTIPAYQVKRGDRIYGNLVTSVLQNSTNLACWTRIEFDEFPESAVVISEWPITVARQVDECPRGKLAKLNEE